ncbi:hypothetical protein DF135_16565 [Burkholderia cepacia]|nr:hypothetical protein DF135_16565 [Burkholderia cepacia]
MRRRSHIDVSPVPAQCARPCDQVRAQQCSLPRHDCDPRNAKLCAYYEALGFARVALRPLPGGYIASFYERAVAG